MENVRDILVQILTLLTTRKRMQMRRVCKTWKTIVEQLTDWDKFIRVHLFGIFSEANLKHYQDLCKTWITYDDRAFNAHSARARCGIGCTTHYILTIEEYIENLRRNQEHRKPSYYELNLDGSFELVRGAIDRKDAYNIGLTQRVVIKDTPSLENIWVKQTYDRFLELARALKHTERSQCLCLQCFY